MKTFPAFLVSVASTLRQFCPAARVVRTMKLMLPLVMLCPLMQGCLCVGVFVSASKVQKFEHASLTPYPVAGGVLPSNQRGAICSSDWLVAHWGKPRSITRRSGGHSEEIWTYKFGSILTGVMLCFVVPVPLVVPLNREQVRFTLRDGMVVAARQTTECRKSCAVGWFTGPCGANAGWKAWCGDSPL